MFSFVFVFVFYWYCFFFFFCNHVRLNFLFLKERMLNFKTPLLINSYWQSIGPCMPTWRFGPEIDSGNQLWFHMSTSTAATTVEGVMRFCANGDFVECVGKQIHQVGRALARRHRCHFLSVDHDKKCVSIWQCPRQSQNDP